MNSRGATPVVITVMLVYIIGMTGWAIGEMEQKGTLKKNGQTVWCKMQNKGADYCNAKYGYNPLKNKFE